MSVASEFSTSEKSKLSGIDTNAQENVQSDWNETNTTADDFIQNKPSLPFSGQLVPAGGNTGQVLSKASATDGDTEWAASNLSSVSSDSTLSGDGTGGNPLRVVNEFTSADEQKLDGITAGAEPNIGAEFTQEEKSKLGDIASNAEVNIRADWEEENINSDSYIQNKPTIPTGGGSGVSTFASLTDTPSSFGTAGQAVIVNQTEDGLIYGNAVGGSGGFF